MSTTHTHAPTANRAGRSNATGTEEGFVQAVQRRFRTIRGLIRRSVGYENDALRLSANADELDIIDLPTDQGKAAAFERWLDNAVEEEILEPMGQREVANGNHWTGAFIRAAFIAGVNQATGLLFQREVNVENLEDGAIPTTPVFESTLRDLYTKAYDDLESITEDVAPQVRETLTQGFAEGWNPRKMALELTAEVRTIQRTRAETLARTATIDAHAQATLDNYERAGVGLVSHGEWLATPDDRVCEFCARLSGAELTMDEMRGTRVEWRGDIYQLRPPSHLRGRCVILPVVGGEEPTEPLSERVPGTVITTF